MLPPPPVRGLFRTDHRARAAYAEAAGIFRILPAAVCVPRDREDVASLAHWASAHRVALVPRGAGSAMVVELNPLPGILPDPRDNSCFPKAARAAGMGYDELIRTVADIAWRRISGRSLLAEVA